MADEPDGGRHGNELTLTAIRPGGGGETELDVDFDPRLEPGEIVAGRYEVERFLAKGGMGEVYRVLDRELNESIALKTILPRSLDDPMAMGRFRREIQIARKISHPNVCRIFDLGRYVREGAEDVVFFTMELLSGHSLRARLHDGPLRTHEALSVTEQLCAGLGAAHGKGIIHRDLKPSNIFLVPIEGGNRVVITDFGLARAEVKEDDELSVTRTGEILGTPAYMAPEQLEGKEATAASDIYALGLVIYEMLTGAKPFEGASAFQIALNKLRETPSTPSSQVNGLPPMWDRTVLRCLEAEPDDRFGSVDEIPAALVRPRGGGLAYETKSWRRIGFLCAALMMIAAVVLVGAKLAKRLVEREESAPVTVSEPVVAVATDLRDSMAILGFENVTGHESATRISGELAGLITNELASGREFRMIPRDEVLRARLELGIQRVTTLGPETQDGLKDLLGVDFIVFGSFAAFGGDEGGSVRLDARVQDISAGEIIMLPTMTGAGNELESMAADVAAEVCAALGFDETSDEV